MKVSQVSRYSHREDGMDASRTREVLAYKFLQFEIELTGPPTANAGMEISTTLLGASSYILPEGRSEAAVVAPERICRRTGATKYG